MKPKKSKLGAQLIAIVGLAITLLMGGCGKALRHQCIPANIDIEVKDPLCRRLTDATEKFEVEAAGEFKAGSFFVQGVPVRVTKGTMFRLSLTLPICDPAHINTAVAKGHLWTSSPLFVAGVPVSQDVSLSDGQATVEVDLIRTIGIFLFNVLQNQLVDVSGGSGVRNLIEYIGIKHAVLYLRPGAAFDIGKIHLIAAPKSKVELNGLALDKAWNYDGELFFDMHFGKGCEYIGERIDLLFNGGNASFRLHARRVQSVVTLSSVQAQRLLNLEDCTYKFGRQKQSSVTAELALLDFSQFYWQKRETEEKSRVHALAAMVLRAAHVKLQNPRVTLTAKFTHAVPSTLQVDRDPNGRQILFSTDKSATAGELNIDLHRKNTSTSIALTNAQIGPIALSKSGELDFSLEEGTADLSQIKWQRGSKEFRLTTSRGSTLSITRGLSMALTRDESGTRCSLPLSIKFGKATLTGSIGTLKLSDLSGNLQVEADNDVTIEGDLAFSIVQSDLLGNRKVDLQVRGINVASKIGHATIHFNQCSIVVPNDALHDEIRKSLPREKIYEVDKTVFSSQKWRYRNAVVKNIVLRNPTIDKLWSVKDNEEHFAGSGDIQANGTVEKSGVLSLLSKNPSKWEERPWTASARVTGDGVLSYQFVPNGALSDSQFNYSLNLNLPLPEDLELDWSRVSGGILQKAEKSIIIGLVRKNPPIALKLNGKFKLFGDRKSQLKSLKISQFTAEPAGEGIEMKFVADAAL